MYVWRNIMTCSGNHSCKGNATIRSPCTAELHVHFQQQRNIECCTTMVLWQTYVGRQQHKGIWTDRYFYQIWIFSPIRFNKSCKYQIWRKSVRRETRWYTRIYGRETNGNEESGWLFFPRLVLTRVQERSLCPLHEGMCGEQRYRSCHYYPRLWEQITPNAAARIPGLDALNKRRNTWWALRSE